MFSPAPLQINPDRLISIAMNVPCEGQSFHLRGITDPANPQFFKFEFVACPEFKAIPSKWEWLSEMSFTKTEFARFEWYRSDSVWFRHQPFPTRFPLLDGIPVGIHSLVGPGEGTFALHTKGDTPDGIYYTGKYNPRIKIPTENEDRMWEEVAASRLEDLHPIIIPPDFNQVQHIVLHPKNQAQAAFTYLPNIYKALDPDKFYNAYRYQIENERDLPSFMCVRKPQYNRTLEAHMAHNLLGWMPWVRMSPNVFEYEDRGVKLIATMKYEPPHSDSTYKGGIWF